MKKQLLRLLPVAAVLLTASCTDDQYDISNVDTESRFTAKGLVIPLNMSPIMLDNIISLNEDGDIKEDKDGNYYFQKKGDINSEEINVNKITITKPNDISQKVTVTIPSEILTKWELYAPDKNLEEIQTNSEWSAQVGITPETVIVDVSIKDAKNITMSANNIDKRITALNTLGIEDFELDIDIKLDGLKNLANEIKVTNMSVALPRGMEVKDNDNYNRNDGKLTYDNLTITNGQKNIKLTVSELIYGPMKQDGAEFTTNVNPDGTGSFVYNKLCEVEGSAKIKAGNLNGKATLQDFKEAVGETAEYGCDVKFNKNTHKNIEVKTFSGGFKYKINDIEVAPVNIENLPEILSEEGTKIQIANPQLYLKIYNPYRKNNITTSASLRIEGNVEDYVPLTKNISINEENNCYVLSPENENLLYSEYKNYWVDFDDLANLLGGKKIPERLDITVEIPELNINNVDNFELGKSQSVTGSWEFYTKFSLTDKTNIKYIKEWDDWGSDDLNGLTVNNAEVTFNMRKDVALDAEVTFSLIGETIENGKKVEKKLVGHTSLTKDEQEVPIKMEGNPVKNIKGGKLEVKLKGQGKEINTNQKIEISNLRMKVDGYYDKEF